MRKCEKWLKPVILFVRMWVEMWWLKEVEHGTKSSSSWGCELKYYEFFIIHYGSLRHPLREDVSWNIQPITDRICEKRHPLREDVSWNISIRQSEPRDLVILFVRMWVEIYVNKVPSLSLTVILFVRMWVEIFPPSKKVLQPVRHPLREDVSWNMEEVFHTPKYHVILFVRMWVEITTTVDGYVLDASSSSWGCELKYLRKSRKDLEAGHPLREDVSWNWNRISWKTKVCSHPLREDVSWNFRWSEK